MMEGAWKADDPVGAVLPCVVAILEPDAASTKPFSLNSGMSWVNLFFRNGR